MPAALVVAATPLLVPITLRPGISGLVVLVPGVGCARPQVPTKLFGGTTTDGLVTGSTIRGDVKGVIGLTPKLPISIDPIGIPIGVPRILDDDPTVVDGIPVMLEDAVEQVFNSVERI
jgi:hypothetical protein